MTLQYQKLRDWQFKDRIDSYSERDSIIYALSLGYGDMPLDEYDLPYVYEGNTLAVPTVLSTVGAPGGWMRNPETGIDWIRLLHGEHRMTFHAPATAKGSVMSKTRVSHVVDKGHGRGALIVTTRQIYDALSNHLMATVEHVAFCRSDGGFGHGDNSLSPLPNTPNSEPTDCIHIHSAAQAALWFRLNGDLNPIHILPKLAVQAGFNRPTLHGLCAYGMAARALIRRYCPLNPEQMRSFAARFSAPFYPGDTLIVKLGRRVQQCISEFLVKKTALWC